MRDNTFKLLILAASATLLTPFSAHAAGLGRLTVYSTLGQPLNAEVELLAVQKNETITARLASPEVYQQANAQFNNALTGTRLTVEKRPNGQLYLKATTPRPINEPFVELLIEINSEHGRVLRQYTALLDPPGYGRAAGEIPPPAVASAPETRTSVAAAPSPAPAESLAPPPAAPAPARAPRTAARTKEPASAPPAAASGRTYGPIKPGETLGTIARSVKPEGVSLEQTLVGLYRQNPDAFIRKNLNLVKSGRILTVPEASELAAMPQSQARQEVRMHVADWNTYRGRVADRVAAASETGSVTSGRIGSKVADSAAGEGPRDTVRLSRGDKGQGKGAPAERVRALEEEAIAREKALAEANARIAQLEQIIKDSKRAAELKGATADAKGAEKAAQAPAVVPVPAPPGKAPEAPATVAKGGDAAKAAPADAAAPGDTATKGAPTVTAEAPPAPVPPVESKAAETPPTAKAAAKPPEPEPTAEFDIVDTVLQEPLYLAGLGAVLLGGLGLMVARRRRSAGAGGALDTDDGLVKIPPSLSGAAAGGAGASAAGEPAARSAPTPPPARTAEAAAPTAAAAAPTAAAAARAPTVAPATPATPMAAAAPAAAPARSDADNDLDFHVGSPEPAGTAAQPKAPPQPPLQPQPAARLEPNRSAEPPRAPEPTPRAPEPPRAAEPPPRAAEAPRVEPSKSAEPAPSRAAEVLRAAQQRAAEKPPLEPLLPDFALDAPPAQTPPPAKDPHVLDFDLEPLPPVGSPLDMDKVSTEPPASVDFKLDLGDLDAGASAQGGTAGGPPRDEHWYDVQQKFDLAKAYEEMGDKAGARDILQEVLREGDTDQQQQARKLLATLG